MKTIAVGPLDDAESCVTGGTAVVVVVAVAIVLVDVLPCHRRRQSELGKDILTTFDVDRVRLQRTEYGVRRAIVNIQRTRSNPHLLND